MVSILAVFFFVTVKQEDEELVVSAGFHEALWAILKPGYLCNIHVEGPTLNPFVEL